MINQRQLRVRRRDLLRILRRQLRDARLDSGISQAAIARAAGIAPSHLSTIEAGTAEPSIEVLMAVAAALGADLSVRLFMNTGPVLRDRLQVAMGEALLGILHPRSMPRREVPVYRPVRGVIDVVLEDGSTPDTVATELHSQLRRVEEQVRWAIQKGDALAALPEHDGRRVGRLLVVRNSVAMRQAVSAAARLLTAAYPARACDALDSLTTVAPWPGAAILWASIERSQACILDGPPRGIPVGRSSASRIQRVARRTSGA